MCGRPAAPPAGGPAVPLRALFVLLPFAFPPPYTARGAATSGGLAAGSRMPPGASHPHVLKKSFKQMGVKKKSPFPNKREAHGEASRLGWTGALAADRRGGVVVHHPSAPTGGKKRGVR